MLTPPFPLFGAIFALLTICLSTVYAVPADGSRFLFLGNGDVSDYAADFQAMVNGDSSLGLTITAEGYASTDIIDDYYDGRYLTSSVPNDNNPLLTKLHEDFDYIIILPREAYLETSIEPSLSANNPGLYLEAVHLVKDWLLWRNKTTEVIVPAIWGDAADFDRYNDRVFRIGDATECYVVPALRTWEALQNDSSVNIGPSSLYDSVTNEARFTFAASLFTHFFEKSAENTTFSLSQVSNSEKAAIFSHAYEQWVYAQHLAQYTGEYNDAFCSSGQMVIGSSFGSHTFTILATGTSTEAAIAGSTSSGYDDVLHGTVSAYWYSPTSYFPEVMDATTLSTAGASVNREPGAYYFGVRDYDVVLGRWFTSKASDHNQMKALMHDDVQYVGYWRHSGTESGIATGSLGSDLSGIRVRTEYNSLRTQETRDNMNDPTYAFGLPIQIGYGRFVEERYKSAPYAQDAEVYWGEHLGRYYESWMGSMFYILSTGNKPEYKTEGWQRIRGDVTIESDDWNFAIDQAYEVMMNMGHLKGPNGEHIPVRANSAPLAIDQSANVHLASAMEIGLLATDPEGAQLTYTLVDAPSNGAASLSGNTVTYNPGSFVGTETFTFRANDGSFSSNTAIVTVNVADFSSESEINIRGNGQSIPNDSLNATATDATDFGEVTLAAATPIVHTFTIENQGVAALNLAGSPRVQISGAAAADFVVTAQPAVSSINSGSSTTFEITFTASDSGIREATVHVQSNDSDESDYNFLVQGSTKTYSLTYSATAFSESVADDGSIDNSNPVIITLKNDIFTGANGRDLVADGDLSITNLPSGLVAVAEKVSDTELNVVLNQSAYYHEASFNVSDLTFAFADTAFTSVSAANVTGSTRSDIRILFTGNALYVVNGDDSGPGSLRELIASAPDGDTIRFAQNVTTVTLTSGEITINKDLTITGGGAVTLDAGSHSRHFLISNGTSVLNVTLEGLTLVNGLNDFESQGGSLRNISENVTLVECTFDSNVSNYDGGFSYGGAIYSIGSLTIDASTFSNNVATHVSGIQNARGGAIYQSGGTLIVRDSVFSGNLAEGLSDATTNRGGSGGAIYSINGTATIERCQFIDNSATSVGGGTTIGSGSGGAMTMTYSTGTITDCLFTNNYVGPVAGSGGALQLTPDDAGTAVSLERCTFSGNQANTLNTARGGAINITSKNDTQPTVAINNCTLSGNMAQSTAGSFAQGGAIYQTYGGGGSGTGSTTVNISNSTLAANDAISTNAANGRGGALYLLRGEMALNSALLAGNAASNTSTTGGQDIYLGGATLTAANSLIQSPATDGSHGIANTGSNIVGSDAQLYPLADNGGLTQTHALQAGSPAIGAGSNLLALSNDQRGSGYARVVAAAADIGAYEYAGTSFANWSSGLSDSSPNGDPENDGIGNLMEFALNLDPSLSNNGSQLPYSVINDNHLGLVYRMNEDAIGLDYSIYYSTDLKNWFLGYSTDVTRSPDGLITLDSNYNETDPDGTPKMKATTSMPEASSLFLRLEVSQ